MATAGAEAPQSYTRVLVDPLREHFRRRGTLVAAAKMQLSSIRDPFGAQNPRLHITVGQ
jgi:hypothetical protein